MWLLRNDNKGLIYRVTPEKKHVVTRKDGDLILLGDQSISRKHAELFVEDENEDGGIVLNDLGSKYGTFTIIGDGELTQVPQGEPVTLRCGDCVRFGIQWNCWRAEYVPLLVATSTLTQEEKAEVKQMVALLGGRVVNDWQEKCTHLTMNKLTVTVKVVCALAAGQPIVSPAYWKSFTQALASMQATLPQCSDFLPPLAEAMLNPSEVSFTPAPARSKLFTGRTFVAASAKQLSRIKPMITAAGGSAVEFSAATWSEDKLMEEKVILMQHSASDRQGSQQSQILDGYIPAARKLRASGVRCVPESEIGLSVLHCSMTQYCNPRYSAQGLLGSSSLEATQPVAVICPNTEDSTTSHQNNVEPGPSTSTKRPRDGISEDEEHASKKPHTRVDSEDLFGSQNLRRSNVDKNSNKVLSLKQITSTPKVPTCDSKPKETTSKPDPSLDMFAPSIERSSSSNAYKQDVAKPSCEDLFGSGGSKQTQNNKRKYQDKNEDNGNAFSFVQNKKFNKPQNEITDEGDEFSFSSNRKVNKRQETVANDGDEFSFASNRKSNRLQRREGDKDDEFSFTSSKKSVKRNRQSNPDMFASSVESSTSNNSGSGPSKLRKSEGFDGLQSRENKETQDDLFAFPGGLKPKRKRLKESLNNEDYMETEVKVAFLTKKEDVSVPRCLQTENVSTPIEDPPEEKNLVAYSKTKLATVKEEVTNEELDDLAKELYNATIVVVKPLVVERQKPAADVQPVATGKNFKKFRKVVGINKRIVPHIIGGSDLIPHYADCLPVGDDPQLPPSPRQLTPDDDWGFLKSKKKGKHQ